MKLFVLLALLSTTAIAGSPYCGTISKMQLKASGGATMRLDHGEGSDEAQISEKIIPFVTTMMAHKIRVCVNEDYIRLGMIYEVTATHY
jgi:hypothetical protein